MRIAAIVVLGALGALGACKPARLPGDAERGPEQARIADASPRVDAAIDAAIDAAPAVASCVDDGAPYAVDRLRARVAFLASEELDGRAPGTAGDRAARAHIIDRFRCLGLAPGGPDQSYEQAFDNTANVVGIIAGRDPSVGSDIILVGAHHDHLGDGRLGANDNASGVAALLAVAQAVRQGGAPRRTIAFVAFGAEERGLVGSAHFVAHPPAAVPLDRVVEMINLDMVGSHASTNSVAAFGTFPKLPARALLDELGRTYRHLRIHAGGLCVRGDHLDFCKRDIPYVFFWTPDRRCYHEKCDTAARLDYARMADIASLAGALVQGLADSALDLAAVKARRGCGV